MVYLTWKKPCLRNICKKIKLTVTWFIALNFFSVAREISFSCAARPFRWPRSYRSSSRTRRWSPSMTSDPGHTRSAPGCPDDPSSEACQIHGRSSTSRGCTGTWGDTRDGKPKNPEFCFPFLSRTCFILSFFLLFGRQRTNLTYIHNAHKRTPNGR